MDKYKLPPKILVVHRFTPRGVTNYRDIALDPNVQIVMHMDGFGPPHMKLDTWGVVVQQQPIEYNGIKLFYGQDEPLMTPADIMALEPTPDVINYQ